VYTAMSEQRVKDVRNSTNWLGEPENSGLTVRWHDDLMEQVAEYFIYT
jgi:hypothetical protein